MQTVISNAKTALNILRVLAHFPLGQEGLDRSISCLAYNVYLNN